MPRKEGFLLLKQKEESLCEGKFKTLLTHRKKWHNCEKGTVRCSFKLTAVRLMIGDHEDGRKQIIVRKCNEVNLMPFDHF